MDLGFDMVDVRDVGQRFRLLFQRLDDPGVRMAQGADGDPGDQVEIGLPVVVPDVDSQPPGQDNGEAFVVRHEVVVGKGKQFSCVHL